MLANSLKTCQFVEKNLLIFKTLMYYLLIIFLESVYYEILSQKYDFLYLFLASLLMAYSIYLFGQDVKQEETRCSDKDYNCLILKYTKSIKENPEDAENYYLRGRLYSLRSNFKKAVNDFDKAIEINEKFIEAHYGRCRSHFFQGDFPAAIKDASKIIELNSEFSDGWLCRALNFSAIGKSKEAREDFAKTLELLNKGIDANPSDAVKFMDRGIVYTSLGDDVQAFNNYSLALELERDYFLIHYYRGLANIYFSNFSDAIKDFTRAIELESEFAESYIERARVYEKIREKKAAEADRKKYKELSEK